MLRSRTQGHKCMRRRNMQRNDEMRVLNDPLAQELMGSKIPARVAYISVDGSPRAVPLGFHWNGEQFVICTIPGAPKVRALAAHPQVALTIDTDTFPPHVLLVRGSASLETVRGLYQQMVRITIEPRWAKLLD